MVEHEGLHGHFLGWSFFKAAQRGGTQLLNRVAAFSIFKKPHIHKWVSYGEGVYGSDSSNSKHWMMPDIQRFKCHCGKVKIKRGDFEHILE